MSGLKREAMLANAEDTVRYIGSMAKELRGLAAKQDLGFLAYLLAMVEDEAVNAADARVRAKRPESADAA